MTNNQISLVFIVLSLVFFVMAGIGIGPYQWGWLGIACVVVAAYLVPILN